MWLNMDQSWGVDFYCVFILKEVSGIKLISRSETIHFSCQPRHSFLDVRNLATCVSDLIGKKSFNPR